MNKENINLIKRKYPTLFEERVSCNMFHDRVTDQVNQYPVFTIRFFPLFCSLCVDEVIQSDVTSYSEDFVARIDDQIKSYIVKVCRNALK